jgi:hypothetical protein
LDVLFDVVNYLNGTSPLLAEIDPLVEKFFEGDETSFPLGTANCVLIIGWIIRRSRMGETRST